MSVISGINNTLECTIWSVLGIQFDQTKLAVTVVEFPSKNGSCNALGRIKSSIIYSTNLGYSEFIKGLDVSTGM